MDSRKCLILAAALSCLLASCANTGDRTMQSQVVATSGAALSSAPVPAATHITPASASCPITRPPDPPFVPPPPYSPSAPSLYQGFWYGSAALWTLPRADGIWRGLPYYRGSYTQKVFWWRRGYDYQSDPYPDLIVTGTRLDAPAPPLTASGATNGSRDDIRSFMVVGVDIPTTGCWEITGHSAAATVRFVVWVAP